MDANLAYIAGLVASDGHINKKDYTVTIYTRQADVANIVAQELKRYTMNKVRIRYHRNVYEVYVTDKKLALILSKKYMIPIGRKHDILSLPALSDTELLHYIAGFFDGDGSIYIRRKGSSSNFYEVKIKSNSQDLLKSISKLLEKHGIVFRFKIYPGTTPYIVVSKRDQVYRFFTLIPTRFKRLQNTPPQGAKSNNPGRTTSGEGARLERARR